MEPQDKIIELIYAAIDEVNSAREPDNALEKSPETLLIGGSTSLDSIGLVNLIVSLEEGIERNFHKTITLIDAFATENTQWTVAAACKFIQEELHRLGGDRERARPLSSTSLQ